MTGRSTIQPPRQIVQSNRSCSQATDMSSSKRADCFSTFRSFLLPGIQMKKSQIYMSSSQNVSIVTERRRFYSWYWSA